MKKILLIIPFILLFSCQPKNIENLNISGDLYAKNLVEIIGDFPPNIDEVTYNWFVSNSLDGEWEWLQGITTPRIILLTDYVGKYLQCEVKCRSNTGETFTKKIISSSTVEYKGNPNSDWLRDAKWGIMVHYLKSIMATEGSSKEWNAAVNSFNVEKFAEQVNNSGAGFVMFTLGQNSGYYCSPNSVYSSAVGVEPGVLCSTRDLPMDLIQALDTYEIPLILYLPSNPPHSNELVVEKLQYTFKKDSATNQFNQAILENMIEEWSLRYKNGVKGWWFDGLYDWNNIRSTRMDMSLKHNISTHSLAAKAGNKNSIISYNSGFGKIKANTPYCDYSSGEKMTIDEFPESRWVENGVQWFLFTYLGEKWGGKGQQFETVSLVDMAKNIIKNQGVLCLEVVTNAQGEILPHHLSQISAIGKIGNN